MIEYITGKISELTPASAVIECNGIGYFLNISLTTYSALSPNTATKLFVYESIREDAHVLFGFISRRERDLFFVVNFRFRCRAEYRTNDSFLSFCS